MGYLSEYFCTKRTLEDELTLLRNMSSTDSSIMSKQEEIDDATRDAYLYAAGMVIVMVCVGMTHAWGYHLAQIMGMKMRIITTGAIFNKVLELIVKGCFKYPCCRY